MPWLSPIVSNVLLALLLAVAAWVVQRWLRRPAVAHVLWVLVLVKLVTPPVVSVPVRESPAATACESGTCGCPEHARPETAAIDRLPWVLLAVWSAGALVTGGIAWRRWARFRRMLAHARPAPAEWQALAGRLSSELSLRCPPEVLAGPGRLPPLVVPGRHRPVLLLPQNLMDQLNPSQRAAMLLHELVHLKRGDHWVRVLELTVGVAYWWLPVVGPIGRQLRGCEEACCDAAVVAHLPDARREYARLLLDVVDFAHPLPGHGVAHATAMSAAAGLERRLVAILDAAPAARRSWPAGAVAVGLACAVLPFGLHYDFVGRPVPMPAAAPAERAPAAWANSDRDGDLMKALCCPS